MPDAPPRSGIRIGDVDVSQHTINTTASTIEHLWNKTLAFFERKWEYTLTWIGDHPLQFIAILLFLAWWRYLKFRARIEIAAMNLEYNTRRQSARNEQPPLPLGEPGEYHD